MQVTIHHDPASVASCRALAAIRAAGHEPAIIAYPMAPPAPKRLARLIVQTGLSVHDFIRRDGGLLAELGLDGEHVAADVLIAAMIDHPELINRPIVVIDSGKRIVARLCGPSATVDAFLEEQGRLS